MAPDARPRVVFWFNQPTPYVVARFNAVADRRVVDLEAWFSEARQSDRSWDVKESEWRFRARYIPSRRFAGIRLRIPLPELAQTRPDVFVLEYDRLNLAIGAVAGLVAARRLAFRVLPNFDAWSTRTWWREAAKHLLFRAVDGVKVPGPDGQALAERYGTEPQRASIVRQSVDLARYGGALEVPESERKEQRRALGLSGCVFMFVGRLWQGKGLDELLIAYRNLASELDDQVSLLVVGDGVDEAHYRQLFASLPRVVMPGFIQPAELPRWYALADCLVFPTHGDPNGLVIEEALAAGLPVIVSDAAGDVRRRVPDGVVGHVVPVGSAYDLQDAMGKLALDPAVRAVMAKGAPGLVAAKSDQGYAMDFEAFVADVLRHPRRSGLAARVCRLLGHAAVLAARLQRLLPASYVATEHLEVPA
jgi:glycosyltransferase involved in cell wall biosynthesis